MCIGKFRGERLLRARISLWRFYCRDGGRGETIRIDSAWLAFFLDLEALRMLMYETRARGESYVFSPRDDSINYGILYTWERRDVGY